MTLAYWELYEALKFCGEMPCEVSRCTCSRVPNKCQGDCALNPIRAAITNSAKLLRNQRLQTKWWLIPWYLYHTSKVLINYKPQEKKEVKHNDTYSCAWFIPHVHFKNIFTNILQYKNHGKSYWVEFGCSHWTRVPSLKDTTQTTEHYTFF